MAAAPCQVSADPTLSDAFRRARPGYLAAMSSDRTESGQDPDADPEMKQSSTQPQPDQAEGEDDASETS